MILHRDDSYVYMRPEFLQSNTWQGLKSNNYEGVYSNEFGLKFAQDCISYLTDKHLCYSQRHLVKFNRTDEFGHKCVACEKESKRK